MYVNVFATSGFVGVKPKIVFTELKKGDVRATYADISKARKLLGWKPKTDFKYGLEKQVKWIKEPIPLCLI